MLDAINAAIGPLYLGLFAATALACACGLLLVRNPLSGAINLIGVMLSLAGIYALLDSPFLAVLQVLTYAGAIMMLVVFVIMVLNKAHDREVPRFDWLSLVVAAAPLALSIPLLAAVRGMPDARDASALAGEVEHLAPRLFDLEHGWWLLFLAIGVLLLVAITGAVALAKRRLDAPAAAPAQEEAEHGH